MNRGASTAVGVLVGGAVGAAAALLFAPKRGADIRTDVMNWTRDAEHKAADALRTAGTSVASSVRKLPGMVAEKAPEMGSKLVGMFQKGSQTAEETAGKVESGSNKMEQASGA